MTIDPRASSHQPHLRCAPRNRPHLPMACGCIPPRFTWGRASWPKLVGEVQTTKRYTNDLQLSMVVKRSSSHQPHLRCAPRYRPHLPMSYCCTPPRSTWRRASWPKVVSGRLLDFLVTTKVERGSQFSTDLIATASKHLLILG
jgi:hypothetical protein